jgi:hypothetical protein
MEVQLYDETNKFQMNSQYAFAVKNAEMLDRIPRYFVEFDLEPNDGTKLCW